jgi:hypothetical protein
MKIPSVSRLIVVLVLALVIAPSVYAAGLSREDAANECARALQLYREAAAHSRKVVNMEAKEYSDFFGKPYYLRMQKQIVPVLTFHVDGAPLIILIHKELNSKKEKPVIDAICADKSGHHLTYRKPFDRIEFYSDPREQVAVMFRLDPVTLPNTHWMTPKNDSIWMAEIAEPPPRGRFVPHKDDWCMDQEKDIQTNGADMWFSMCAHDGYAKGFEYTIRMMVEGELFEIDPQIINRPH